MTLTHCETTDLAKLCSPSAAQRKVWWGTSDLGRIEPGRASEPQQTIVESLIRALEARDPYTCGHSIRVGELAAKIGAELGLTARAQAEVRLAGELHDIGKIGIEDALLKSDGALSAEEYRRILDHSVIGERILEPLFRDRPVITGVVRWHHERFDGTGYPDRLRGEKIPLPARIVAVADAYDAMTSARAYRDSLPNRLVAWELANGAGEQFDPACVAALLAILGRESLERRRAARRRRDNKRRWCAPSRPLSAIVWDRLLVGPSPPAATAIHSVQGSHAALTCHPGYG